MNKEDFPINIQHAIEWAVNDLNYKAPEQITEGLYLKRMCDLAEVCIKSNFSKAPAISDSPNGSILILSQSVKRRLVKPFKLCGSRTVFERIADQINGQISNLTFGWIDIAPFGEEPSDLRTENTLEWED